MTFHNSERSRSIFLPRFHRLNALRRRLRAFQSDDEIESRFNSGRPVSWYSTADEEGMVHIHPRNLQ